MYTLLIQEMKFILNMRLFTRLIFLTIFCCPWVTLAQDTQGAKEFMDRLKQEYPEFELIFVNENRQASSFVFTDKHLIIMDSEWNNAYIDSRFFLFDNKSKLPLDTLTFTRTSPNFGSRFFYNFTSDQIYFRPITGSLNNDPDKRFFKSASIVIRVQDNQFKNISYLSDKENLSGSVMSMALNPLMFDKGKSKKGIFLQINGKKISEHLAKSIRYKNVSETLLDIFNYPGTITESEVVVLDLAGSKMFQSNFKDIKETNVVLPEDVSSAKSSELLFDNHTKKLYLRLSFENDEKLYQLFNSEFQALNINLPRPWFQTGSNLTMKRLIFISDSYLYTLLNFTEEGKEFDGIFRRSLY